MVFFGFRQQHLVTIVYGGYLYFYLNAPLSPQKPIFFFCVSLDGGHEMNAIRILTRDRYVLSATHFIPGKPVNGVVIINSATGVKQKFYADFASHLAELGFDVYTYDYRGIGTSLHGRQPGHASLTDWGELDAPAMINYVRQRHPGAPVYVIGHSIGGQLIGMSSDAQRADALIMIASQTPYWRNYNSSLWFLVKVWALWHVIIPLSTRLFGYFPAKKMGLFENLPAEASMQWARWAKNSNYLFDELPEKRKTFEALSQETLVLSFSDDLLAPRAAVEDLLQYYKNLQIEHRHISPEQIGRKSIGHFNFFRKSFKHPLWTEVSDWLLSRHRPAAPVKERTERTKKKIYQ